MQPVRSIFRRIILALMASVVVPNEIADRKTSSCRETINYVENFDRLQRFKFLSADRRIRIIISGRRTQRNTYWKVARCCYYFDAETKSNCR